MPFALSSLKDVVVVVVTGQPQRSNLLIKSPRATARNVARDLRNSSGRRKLDARLIEAYRSSSIHLTLHTPVNS